MKKIFDTLYKKTPKRVLKRTPKKELRKTHLASFKDLRIWYMNNRDQFIDRRAMEDKLLDPIIYEMQDQLSLQEDFVNWTQQLRDMKTDLESLGFDTPEVSEDLESFIETGERFASVDIERVISLIEEIKSEFSDKLYYR